MLLNKLFNKYYDQITAALIPECKKALGKIYIRDIQKALEDLAAVDLKQGYDYAAASVESFQLEQKVVFKPIKLPEAALKQDIKSEITAEWSGFFATISVLIDNHDFYKSIESRLQRKLEGIKKSAEFLASDIMLILSVQSLCLKAESSGKSKEALVGNLRFLSPEVVSPIFDSFYADIKAHTDDIPSYSLETIDEIQQSIDNLVATIEAFITDEKNAQSQHERLFLNYRLRISKELDPLCDRLNLFCTRASQLRSEFIAALIGFEEEGTEDLSYIKQLLDKQFEALLAEVEAMQAVDQANKQTRVSIQGYQKINQLRFFKEAAESHQQSALRAIGDSVYNIRNLPDTLNKINKISVDFRCRIQTLIQAENRYLELKQSTLNQIEDSRPFSITLLDITSENIANLFIANSSFDLAVQKKSRHRFEENKDRLLSGIQPEVIFVIDDLGKITTEPIRVSKSVNQDDLLNLLSQKSVALEISDLVGFIPISVEESAHSGKGSGPIYHILFYCRSPQQLRPEVVGVLQVEQQGKLLYVNKLVSILPLPASIFNSLLETYKKAYRGNAKKMSSLIADSFLANKLKVNFQGDIAKAMAKKRQHLKAAYLEDLRQSIWELTENDLISTSNFVKTVDSLITETLDALLLGEEEKPDIW